VQVPPRQLMQELPWKRKIHDSRRRRDRNCTPACSPNTLVQEQSQRGGRRWRAPAHAAAALAERAEWAHHRACAAALQSAHGALTEVSEPLRLL
jgi:hypothetical protein